MLQYYKYITELNFEDGSIAQVPFTVSRDNSSWRVIITPNSLEDKDYKVVKEAYKNGQSDSRIRGRILLFSVEMSTEKKKLKE